jgi:peptide/nickel transport system permease protein/oligopeptide transport system permease protein
MSEQSDAVIVTEEAKCERPAPATRGIVARLFADRVFIVGALIVGAVAAAALFAPALTRWDPIAVEIGRDHPQPPGGAHLLGTDDLGRDVFARIVYGARLSLAIGVSARLLSTAIGLSLGLVAGFFRGAVETIVMRITDLLLAFPSLLLLIAVAAAFGGSLAAVFLTIGLAGWGGTARLVRSQVLVVREEEYVIAARAAGVPDARLVLRHILPNCMGPVIASFTLGVASAILAEASLSFLGLGAQEPAPSWGNMAQLGTLRLLSAPWLALAPASAIAIVVLGWNLLGDALQNALAPDLARSA